MESPNSGLLEGRDLVKRFGWLTAVDHVSVAVRKGEISVLLGENGAGKTTYLKMLNGFLKPDSGAIFYEGKETRFASAREATKYKIHTIYQNFALIDKFTVAENLTLMFPGKSTQDFNAMLKRHGEKIDLGTKVALLPIGVKQRLEIIGALESDAKVLLLDEPTSVLAYEERDRFFGNLKKLAEERGMAILVTTHKLQDVVKYCYRVTVLKGGRKVLEKLVKETTLAELGQAMFGTSEGLEETVGPQRDLAQDSKTVDVEHLVVKGDNVPFAVQDATFSICKGEIVGIIGVAGNGQLELADAVVGRRKPVKGGITYNVAISRPRKRISLQRVGFVPDDPVKVGLASDLTVKENFGVSIMDQVSGGSFVNWKGLEVFTDEAIQKFEIKCDSQETLLRELSGGNVQKVQVARELGRKADLLVAIHPARGLDAHTTLLVYDEIRRVSERGTSVLLISEDIDESLYLADRIGVMFEGHLSEVKPTKELDRQAIGRMMTGAAMVT